MNTFLALLATAALAITTGACAAGTIPAHGLAPAGTETTVEVTNHNWADMVVYAVRGGTRYRLGMVTSMSTARFEIPGMVVNGSGGVSLAADPVGSTDVFVTQPMQVVPGQRVEFNIENHIATSSYSVWKH